MPPQISTPMSITISSVDPYSAEKQSADEIIRVYLLVEELIGYSILVVNSLIWCSGYAGSDSSCYSERFLFVFWPRSAD